MWRMGVPVATPLRLCDWLAGCCALLRRADHKGAFEQAVRELLGASFTWSVSSGRAALFLTLRAMSRMSARSEVVIPAFVCPSVGRAVVKAQLQPVLCDVAPRGFGLDVADLETVLSRHTLAVVIPHLYGYPSEVQAAIDLARTYGALVIEDAAQAFGARLHGRFTGAIADAGVFSFGMSKVLGTIGGGVIATSNPVLRRELESLTQTLRPAGALESLNAVGKMAIAGILVRSHHLRPFTAIWEGTMRGKHDCEDFAAAEYPSSSAAVAQALLACSAEIGRVRAQNASYFSRRLSAFDGIILPETTPASTPVCLRFPIVVEDIAVKREILRRLRERGINASEMYTRESYEALRGFASRRTPCPRTEYLVERMLNLPTHSYMRERDIADTVRVFSEVLTARCTRQVAIA